MEGHDCSNSGVHRCPERHELHGIETAPAHSYDREREVRIHASVAVTRKMLSCRDHAVILQPVNERNAHSRCQIRILTIRSGVDDRIIRIVIDV